MNTALSSLAREHLDRVRAFYDAAPTAPQAGARAYRTGDVRISRPLRRNDPFPCSSPSPAARS